MSIQQLVENGRSILADDDSELAGASSCRANQRSEIRRTAYTKVRRPMRLFTGPYFRSGDKGHIAACCPENEKQEGARASASSRVLETLQLL